MRPFTRIAARALAALACVLAVAGGASAAGYPDRVVTLVVPYPPGGGVDAMARVVAAKLSDAFHQQVIVDNKPGAGGTLGTRAGRPCHARRLHAAARPHRHHLDQSQPVRPPRLRSAQGLRAHRAGRLDAGGVDRQSRVPGANRSPMSSPSPRSIQASSMSAPRRSAPAAI